jgi:hypothetical protein
MRHASIVSNESITQREQREQLADAYVVGCSDHTGTGFLCQFFAPFAIGRLTQQNALSIAAFRDPVD